MSRELTFYANDITISFIGSSHPLYKIFDARHLSENEEKREITKDLIEYLKVKIDNEIKSYEITLNNYSKLSERTTTYNDYVEIEDFIEDITPDLQMLREAASLIEILNDISILNDEITLFYEWSY